MRGRLLFVAGAAVGYVLGARAGRKRYEQIAGAASKVWESPGIQKQVDKAEDYVAAKIGEIPGALVSGVQKIVQSSSSRGSSGRDSASAAGDPASGSSDSTSPGSPDVASTVAEARSAGSKASSAATTKAKKTT